MVKTSTCTNVRRHVRQDEISSWDFQTVSTLAWNFVEQLRHHGVEVPRERNFPVKTLSFFLLRALGDEVLLIVEKNPPRLGKDIPTICYDRFLWRNCDFLMSGRLFWVKDLGVKHTDPTIAIFSNLHRGKKFLVTWRRRLFAYFFFWVGKELRRLKFPQKSNEFSSKKWLVFFQESNTEIPSLSHDIQRFPSLLWRDSNLGNNPNAPTTDEWIKKKPRTCASIVKAQK